MMDYVSVKSDFVYINYVKESTAEPYLHSNYCLETFFMPQTIGCIKK